MENKQLSISSYSQNGAAILQKISENESAYIDFLKFQGRVFKHNVNVALEFYAQNPETEFIATKEQWAKVNCTISSGSNAIRFVDSQGRAVDLFDFSQVDEGIPPYRWTLNSQNVSKLKENLSFSSDKPFLSELINHSLTPTEITDCMKALDIPPSEFPIFSKSYVNAVQLVISGRLEIGGNRFSVAPDTAAFKMLDTETKRLTFLTYASNSARSALMTIENEIIRINNEERNVNYDLRNMENSDRSRTGERTGRGTSDNSETSAHEQLDRIESNSSGRSASMESDSSSEQRRKDETLTGIQAGTVEQSDILVQAQSDGRNIQSELGTGRTDNGGRTDRDVRSEMDRLYGEGVSALGSSNEISSQVSDGSSLGGQSSLGVQGITGQPIRTGESSSNELRGNIGLGTGSNVLFGQHSNEGKSPDSDNRILTDDEKLFQLTSDLQSKEIEFTSLVEKRDFQQISVVANEIAQLQQDISNVKDRIANQPITESDIQALREIRPKRKSVQNMLESEVAQTPKFESLLHTEMSEKSAYEMRKESGNKWRNDNSTLVPIITVPKRDISNIRKDKKDGTIERGSFVNKDTNITVIFGSKGIDGSLAHALQEVNRNNPTEPRLAAIYCMRDLIENAVCFDSQLSEKKSKSPNSLFMHRMYAIFNYDDNFYLANLAIDETYSTDRSGNFATSESLYNAKSIKITPVDDLGFQSHDLPQSGSEPTDVTTISIAQLYEIVKKYDKNFFENPNSPGRAEREAELFISAAYKDAVSSYNAVLEQAPISDFIDTATYPDFQLVTTEQQKALSDYADSRNLSIEEAEIQKNELMSIYVHFDFVNDSNDISLEAKLHNAFAEVYSNNPDLTDKQKTYLTRLEKFAVKHNITENLVDTAFEKQPAFVYAYGKRNLLSKTVFFGQLGTIENQLNEAINNQLNEKVDTNINLEADGISIEPEEQLKNELIEQLSSATEDRILINRENKSIYTAYFNPDSTEGGQLVYNTFDFDILAEALKTDDIFNYVSENGKITLCDITDLDFIDSAKEFLETKWDYIGNINDFRTELSEFIGTHSLSEEEELFQNADLTHFIAVRSISYDEWEDMAYPMFVRGYLESHNPSEKALFGSHLSEPEMFALAQRYHNGEDIRRELALSLLDDGNSADIEFIFEDGKISDRTYYSKENLRHSLHTERTEDGFKCSFGDVERFISFEEIGQTYIDRIHEEFNGLAFWWVRDDMLDAVPDISDEKIHQLIEAFDNNTLANWDTENNQAKINSIKNALYDVLGDETQTEKAFEIIAKQKYNVSFDNEKTEFEDFKLDWHIIHEADDDNGRPTEWSAKIDEGKFIWIDKIENGFGVFNTDNTEVEPLERFSTLDAAMNWVENDYLEAQNAEILPGYIEKYNLDINFKEIKEITLQTEWEDYIGGIDSDGHEREDNVELKTDTVTIQYNSELNSINDDTREYLSASELLASKTAEIEENSTAWRIYIIPDMKSLSSIEYYNSFDEAKARFNELRQQEYNAEEISLEDSKARLTLGIESADTAFDVLQVRGNRNVLVDDYTRHELALNDENAMGIISQVSNEIGFDVVMSFPTLVNGEIAKNPEFIPFENWNADFSSLDTEISEPTQLAFDFESDSEEKIDTNINLSEKETSSDEPDNTEAEQIEVSADNISENAEIKAPQKRHRATIQEKLYKQFTEQYPDIANGTHTYERYGKRYDEYGDNDAFEPLSIEYLGDNTYGFMTSYILNGDLMRDPDFTFKLDNESKTLTVLEYQLDGVPGIGTMYEYVHDENGNADKKLLSALSENLMQCLQVAKDVNRPLTEYTDANGNSVKIDANDNLSDIDTAEVLEDTAAESDTLAEIVYAENPTAKIRDNIAAIRELKRIEDAIENNREPYSDNQRFYTSKENSDQRLRSYCGWGGLSEVFDERTNKYIEYRNILKELLTPEEYKAASASTLNAHYTSQNIIDSMYKAVKNMDLPRNARILEPACGTGNFISRLPGSLGDSEIVGVELDSLTARIAKHLNSQNDNVRIIESGFEKTQFENDSFDLAIGNVPFGDYNLNDPDYVNDWRIHDAFFRKSLDKVAPGGVVAFITSTGTMDKKNPKIREYLATKAELIGAIRLPNNAFAAAGTKASSDIIFLKKRENPLQPFEPKPDWCYTVPNEDGLRINSYFVKNPQMILGKMEKTTHYDMLTCVPFENAELDKQLDEAIKNLNAKINVTRRNATINRIRGNIEPWGKNFTYQIKDNNIYYRQSENMIEQKLSDKEKAKITALCEIRDVARQLIDMQQSTATDEMLVPVREKLNKLYDDYKEQNGLLSTKEVKKLFGSDSDFPLILSLEKYDKESNSLQKADIFYQRTVNPTTEINSVDTVEEALQVALDRKGKPDIPYMAVLLENKYPDCSIEQVANTICNEMLDNGYVFIDPEQNLPDTPYSGIVERSEYLSGNVRMKLTLAEEYAKTSPIYEKNIEALKEVIPEDIKAEEISVQMGCSWIEAADYTRFLQHLSGRTGNHNNRQCDVTYSSVTGEFSVLNAGSQKNLNVNESTTYGTSVYNMYQLAEKILNQRRIVVMTEKPHPTDPDKTVTRTDAKQTKIALDKAKLIREEFNKWIFADPERKAKYERKYNDIFNSLVGREYDGSKLTFPGLTTLNGFALRPHQKNCVARSIYGGNTLAAHVVGAGKSAVMFTTVMKKKELGLINKACVVVPKPLTEQTANEWRKLYPNAKILTVTNDDLSNEAKRNIFTARVATGSYDAVILSQEQYEKIPMSKEYRISYMQKELDALEDMMRERASVSRGKKDFSVKALEKAKKQFEARIEKLTNPKAASRAKDDLLEFEQLGFDYLVVDEAHAYKNGFVTTKMTNVAGVTTRPSGRAEDMQMKTDYFNEKLGQGHILFCTGTPVSNSMTELYVMTRYLRPDLLKQTGVERFDDWAATFGSVVTKNQQAADGTLKLRTSFAKFSNLPELMAMYKEFADVQSADKLNLPRPKLKTGKPQIIKVPASPEQKAYVKELAERAEAIANGVVDPSEDNLLKITGEARLIGLGNNAIRSLYNKRDEELPFDFQDTKDSKVDKCIANVAKIYGDTNEQKGVQIIFSDIAVNSDNDNFSVYNYIKKELTETYGIPENEIIFAPKSDSKERENIFKDINNAKYRVVIASTGTLGTGANIQQNLYALHHIDVPWKPSDFEQREGRILRQGNNFEEVEIFNYVTEGTLDSYLYQTVTDKARFIAQLIDDKCPARVSEDCDEKVLTFGEIQAAAEGNPAFKRRIECANEIAELTMLRNDYVHETGQMQKKIDELPTEIEQTKARLERIKKDKQNSADLKEFSIKTSDGRIIADKKEINEFLLNMVNSKNEKTVISINNFNVSLAVSPLANNEIKFIVRGSDNYSCSAGETENADNYQRLSNLFVNQIPVQETNTQNRISLLENNLQQATERVAVPFPHEQELEEKIQELQDLEKELSGISVQQDDIIDAEEEPIIETGKEKNEREKLYEDIDDNDIAVIENNDDDNTNYSARTM